MAGVSWIGVFRPDADAGQYGKRILAAKVETGEVQE